MKYGFEWTPGLVLLAMVIVLPLVPPFALIAVAALALAAVAALVALAGAVLASPYLLVRYLHRRLAEPRRSTEAPGAVARVIAARKTTHQSGFAALANATTARGSR
jgi:membrane protein implicated in regulation of membrane protease activity